MLSVLLDDRYRMAFLKGKGNLMPIALVLSVAVTLVINYYGHCKRDFLSRRYVYQILPIEVYLIELLL